VSIFTEAVSREAEGCRQPLQSDPSFAQGERLCISNSMPEIAIHISRASPLLKELRGAPTETYLCIDNFIDQDIMTLRIDGGALMHRPP
jgi:hypothetical protein